jgi:sugar phosphate isomerase/epimerase
MSELFASPATSFEAKPGCYATAAVEPVGDIVSQESRRVTTTPDRLLYTRFFDQTQPQGESLRHTMKRRQFLGTSLALGTMLAQSRLLFALDRDNKYLNEIGIQLYTLRNEIKDDVEATLKAVADAGYKQVEPYGFPDAKPMMDAANEYGLAVNSSHFAWDSVVNPDEKGVAPFSEILDKANDAGLTHLVIPYLQDRNRETLDDYRLLAERCNKAAEQAKQAGIQLAYHNHAFEFKPMEGGKTGYDVMMEEFSPDMKFEVDVFWVQVGGKDSVELIRSLKGRVSQLHLKDLNENIDTPNYGSIPKEAFEELGDGVIPMEPIIDVAEEAGVAICHVEQDHSPHPLKSIRQSMDYLESLSS